MYEQSPENVTAKAPVISWSKNKTTESGVFDVGKIDNQHLIVTTVFSFTCLWQYLSITKMACYIFKLVW